MSIEFDTALPSVRQVQTLIKSGNMVELKLITGDLLTGKLGWQDHNCICLFDENNRSTAIWRHAIAFIRPIS